MVRILLVDEHDVVRHGLLSFVEMQENWSVVGEAANGRQALELTAKLRPDVVILDIALSEYDAPEATGIARGVPTHPMPIRDGFEVVRQIRQVSPGTEVLIFSGDISEGAIHAALSAGALGYLPKSDTARSVIAAVQALMEHRHYFSDDVREIIVRGFIRATEGAQGVALTLRETQIVRLLAESQTNRQIAAQLNISIKTVARHRASAMRKVKAHTIVDLIRFVLRSGLRAG